MRRLIAILALLVALAPTAHAGGGCRLAEATPAQLRQASETGARLREKLESRDAPVALVARVGTDLSRFDLTYSHLGIAVRDHPDGRWTVVHLLNECGTDHSAIYAEGLANFFLDDLVSMDGAVVWLEPALASRVAERLASDPVALHEPRYSVIARYDSARYQNSTSWVLEELAMALHDLDPARGRGVAHAQLSIDGYRPDVLHIPYAQRLAGGLFMPNVAFTDHPIGARLAGEYPVVTVRSITAYLEAQHASIALVELAPHARRSGLVLP